MSDTSDGKDKSAGKGKRRKRETVMIYAQSRLCFLLLKGFLRLHFAIWFRWKYVFPMREVIIMIFNHIIYRCFRNTEPVRFLMRGIPPTWNFFKNPSNLLSSLLPCFPLPKNWSPHSEGWRRIQKSKLACQLVWSVAPERQGRGGWETTEHRMASVCDSNAFSLPPCATTRQNITRLTSQDVPTTTTSTTTDI